MQLSLIQNKIYEVRGQKVMLDFDLAELYGIETRVLKQAVRRNLKRFPDDFMFQLTKKEFDFLRSQFVILKKSGRGQHPKYLPFAFTEQGVAMLSSILNSDTAIEVNIAIMRTFVLIRQYALNYKDLQQKLQRLEKKYNKNFKEIYHALNLLLERKQFRKSKKTENPLVSKQNHRYDFL